MINIEENINLKAHTTFGVDSRASKFVRFSSLDELKEIFALKPEPFMILGGGSNMLLTQDYDGWVIQNQIKGIEVFKEDDDYIYLKVGAGENWHEFVQYCINHNYGGVENLSLIPGNVGTSPMQNIGAYGVEIKDIFDHLEAYLINEQTTKTFHNSECNFGYRESIFKRELKNKAVITHVCYRLTKKNHVLKMSYGAIQDELQKQGVEIPSIKDISQAVIAIRQSKLPDPKEIGNAGSFFKNPVISAGEFELLQSKYPEMPNYPAGTEKVKLAAGWLIEQSGWKGKTFGNFGVHKKQALVLVNYGGAQGKDIYDLSAQIIEDVRAKFGVELEREVNII
ncbi:UDP-N-acetylmuramate dehydrogenase [Lishizhenia tianjinensis]|uniref:UDP-N-acetylenolpyruvoylglucosamine reductase n=1 Tax=Lishizhenia tianjinensis TaxID=477690 RepID=A0A1I6Z0R1_9FLAO|nr:UDP-N-acetylmuramate dehydrogenase [Lishizhenia tianjinensis]